MESTNVQVSYDRHTFTKLHSGASELVQNPLTCNRLKFDVPNQYWNWKITAGT
jgi:hypothetical protein